MIISSILCYWAAPETLFTKKVNKLRSMEINWETENHKKRVTHALNTHTVHKQFYFRIIVFLNLSLVCQVGIASFSSATSSNFRQVTNYFASKIKQQATGIIKALLIVYAYTLDFKSWVYFKPTRGLMLEREG